MTNAYGPWATAIDPGRNPQLSAFWRQRLVMLVPTSKTKPFLSSRSTLALIIAAVFVVSIPTLRSATSLADEPAKRPAKSETLATDPKHEDDSSSKYISGVIVDESKRPVQEASVRIFETSRLEEAEHLLRSMLTDAQGKFRLELPAAKKGYYLTLKLNKKGLASQVFEISQLRPPEFNGKELVIPKAQSLHGRVTGLEGQPIAGADVWTPDVTEPIAGFQSAKTDANGYFDIPDLEAWQDDGMPGIISNSTYSLADLKALAHPGANKLLLRVSHPDYGCKLGPYSTIPVTVNVAFGKPSVLTGNVVDQAKGTPVPNLKVMLQQVQSPFVYGKAVTNDEGEFRLLLQGSGTCELWFEDLSKADPKRLVTVDPGSPLDITVVRVGPGSYFYKLKLDSVKSLKQATPKK